MKRQNILLGILALVVLVVLPWNYLDGLIRETRTEVELARDGLLPMARQAAELRRREAALAGQKRQVEAIRSRLVTGTPFAAIQGELAAAAKASGATLGAFTLERGEAVAELPGVLRYKAVLEVSGSRQQYLQFLTLLEQHRLLIELPEVNVRLGAPGQGAEVKVVMPVSFFGAVAP